MAYRDIGDDEEPDVDGETGASGDCGAVVDVAGGLNAGDGVAGAVSLVDGGGVEAAGLALPCPEEEPATAPAA